jgi:hypothetical protein
MKEFDYFVILSDQRAMEAFYTCLGASEKLSAKKLASSKLGLIFLLKVFFPLTWEGTHQSDPGRIRTCDPQIRNLLLYPTELRGHAI